MANAYGVQPLGPSGINMDSAKAMAILGFSPSQTFEATETSEINAAFMKKLHANLKPLPKIKNEEKRKKAQNDRRNEMVKINEALQYLIRKRTKAKYKNEWKLVEQKTFCVNLALQALDDHTKKLRDIMIKVVEFQSAHYIMAYR